jgi:type VI secretion system secreted protein Hcp
MAFDMFLKIDGIDGESADDKHRGEIEIQSFSWGLTKPPPGVTATGATSGKVSVQDFHFVTGTGIQSPPLLVATATGKQFGKAALTVRKSGAEQSDFLKMNLEQVVVSSYQTGGHDAGEAGPTDQFSLNFARIRMSVAQQNADGTLRWVEGGFDVVANRAL